MTCTADAAQFRPARPLHEQVRAVVCDLDGVVYHGPEAIPGAVQSLNRLAERGIGVRFATNNASRSPQVVADHLTELGIDAVAEQVITSATTGADHLARDLSPGAHVLAVGGAGVWEALTDAGLAPVRPTADRERVEAVLQGYGPQVCAADLAEAAFAVAGGARWVVTNTDQTLPTDRGPAPGNGTLVNAVAVASEQEPEVVGKPGPMMYEDAARELGVDPSEILGVGDRLETDILGANTAGMCSAMVLTGVHGPLDIVGAPPDHRPNLILGDLRDLAQPYLAPEESPNGGFICGQAYARVVRGALQTQGGGLELLRAATAALWQAQDRAELDAEAAVQLLRSSVGPMVLETTEGVE